MSVDIYVSFGILIATYIMVISEKVNRTNAAIFGGVAMILSGLALGFYGQEEAIDAIDFNTIGLLFGMMIIVGIMGESGFFEFVAYKTAQASNGSYYRLLGFFMIVTALCSAFLDNVTTILLMVPITFSIADKLEIDPKPFLMAEVMAANIGGTATLIGDPPNIMIGSASGISFIQFIIYLAPIVTIILFVILLYFEFLYKEHLELDMHKFEDIKGVDPWDKIHNPTLMKKSLAVFLVVIALFLAHHSLGLQPWTVAMTGAGLLMVLTFSEPEKVLAHVEWPTLLFFIGFFIIIGGLEESHGIRVIVNGIMSLSGDSLIMTSIIILWMAAFLSMIIDNIPITMALISAIGSSGGLIATLGPSGYAINPLWWALSLGACLGGNGTLIGASANLVMAGVSKRKGEHIDFKEFTKIGLPVALISLVLASVMLYAFIFLRI